MGDFMSNSFADGNVGRHKHISILTKISKRLWGIHLLIFTSEGFNIQLLECKLDYIANSTKIFVNGAWVGVTITPLEMKNKLVLYRRNGLIDSFISIHWNIKRNEILIQTDAGRPCHPLFPVIGDELSFERGDVLEKLENNEIKWKDCLLGFGNRKKDIDINNEELFHVDELYSKNADLVDKSAIIEYLDTQEMESVVMYSSKDNKIPIKKM